MKIFYGISQKNSIDVTDICLDRLRINNIINIPSSESTRATIFTDPYYGIVKYIYIYIMMGFFQRMILIDT